MKLPKGFEPGIYTCYEKLLTDARDTFRGYPGSEFRLIENPSERLTGVEVSLTLPQEDLEYYWQFWIHAEDFNRYPGFDDLLCSMTGRLNFVSAFMNASSDLLEDSDILQEP